MPSDKQIKEMYRPEDVAFVEALKDYTLVFALNGAGLGFPWKKDREAAEVMWLQFYKEPTMPVEE